METRLSVETGHALTSRPKDQHLEMVWITVAEQQKLDRELKLKSKMPEGWTWDDSKYARLDHADVEIE